MLDLFSQFAINRLIVKGFLNCAPLKLDGDIGTNSKKAILLVVDFCKNLFSKKGYTDLEAVEYVGLRLSNQYTNTFSDVAVFWDTQNPQNTRLVEISTTPGVYGAGTITQPVPIYTKQFPNGFSGVAVLVADRYKDAWFLVEENGCMASNGQFFKKWSGAPYLMQAQSVSIGRDGDKDLIIDPQVFEKDNAGAGGVEFGINHHSYYNYEADIVNSISLGCQVFKRGRLDAILPFWRQMTKIKASKRITYTLFQL